MKQWLTAILLCQAAVAALAQTPAAPQGAHFRCGGIGQDEQARIKSEAGQHSLLVTFSVQGGAYLADLDVEISHGGRVVAQGACRGPLMLVDVSEHGAYEIRARSQGREQSKSVTLAGKPAQLSFVWPNS